MRLFVLTVGSFLVTVELLCLQLCFGAFLHLEFFTYSWSFFCLQLSFFAYSRKRRLISTSMDCKQRSSTVSKKAPTVGCKQRSSTVSKEAPTVSKTTSPDFCPDLTLLLAKLSSPARDNPPHIAQYPLEIVSQRGVSHACALFS